MQLTIDSDVTSEYVDGWALTLTISPSSDSAHFSWAPDGLESPETFEIRLGRNPLIEDAVAELRRAFEDFPRLDIIGAASWGYFHEQNCWRWAEGPWWAAVADLEAHLWPVIDSSY
ncbi:hypothetical protein [Streptomyces goshikiensis]|uniref:hypothetical protein n=1 Tax=Streptomyces goshikiensis TaxID=1942 RepID=UPI0036B77509